MPAFDPSCIPSSLRPLLSSRVIRVIWMFPWPLMCQLFFFLGLFSGMVFRKFLPHLGRGADLVEVVVDSLEEVSRGKLFSLLPRLAPVGCFDWPPFDIYAPQFVWTESAACVVGSEGRVKGICFGFGERDNGPGSLMGFIRTKLLLLDQRYLPQVLRVREQRMFSRL